MIVIKLSFGQEKKLSRGRLIRCLYRSHEIN